jgi:hypothetical protein
MGLFDDFNINPDEIKAASNFSGPDDGSYEWEISEDARRDGTPSKPNYVYITFDYDLDEAGSFREWFTIGVKDDSGDIDTEHEAAKKSLPYLKQRLESLGFDPHTYEPGDAEGLTGSFRLQTKKGTGRNKDNTYQNIVPSSFVVYEGAEPAPEPEPVKPAARPARRPRAAAPAAVSVEDENPFDQA